MNVTVDTVKKMSNPGMFPIFKSKIVKCSSLGHWACCWRLGLAAGGLPGTRAHCWRLGLAAGWLSVAGLTVGQLPSAGGSVMVSLKVLRTTGGSKAV